MTNPMTNTATKSPGPAAPRRTARSRPEVPVPSVADVQGIIVRGYNLGFVRHVVVTIDDPRSTLAHLRAATSGAGGVTQIQSAAPWGDAKPRYTHNVAFTHTGLAALGVRPKTLGGFPTDFQHGAPARALKIGDFGDSGPEKWDAGMNDTARVHAVWTIHGQSEADLDAGWAELEQALQSGITIVRVYSGAAFPGNLVHFGYVDSISQPHIEGFDRPNAVPDKQPVAPLGSFFLGHESQFENVFFDVPDPVDLVANGTYNAFRVLEQDVFGFEEYLRIAGEANDRDPEWIAAKMCGRWRNGNPMDLFPDEPGEPMDPKKRNDYGYPDSDGSVCPIGSHMRRANPRNAPIVQRAANHTRRIVRRGTPYGPLISPGQERDDLDRGLLGNFFCGSITAQFEGVQYDWLNLGLQHPDITGTNDPLLGANDPATSSFTIPIPGEDPIVLTGFPRFVRTRASAYTFLPSLPGLRSLSVL